MSENLTRQRLIALESCLNVRDVGGYPTEDGRQTRWDTVIRADNLDKLPPSGQEKLLELGIRTIIDLRSPGETMRYRNVFATSRRVNYLNLPLIKDEETEQVHLSSTRAGIYKAILDQCRSGFEAVFTALARPETFPVVLHCAAGKDRTGLVIALLLSLARVRPEVIAQDYALSQDCLAERIAIWRAEALLAGQDVALFERDVNAAPENMLETLHYLQEQHDGPQAYLQSCGLTVARLETLKACLID